MSRTIDFPGVSAEVTVGLLAIACSFLVPEVRQFLGLEKIASVEAAQVEPAPSYPYTRRLDKPQRLEANKPFELYPNFFVTYIPKPDPAKDRSILYLNGGNWGDLELDAGGRTGPSRRTVWPESVVRHQGDYQETLFLVKEITSTYIVIR